jgi:hypothetical protein
MPFRELNKYYFTIENRQKAKKKKRALHEKYRDYLQK